jgi:hypothetical protein
MRLLKDVIDTIRGFFPEQVPIWVKALFWVAIGIAVLGNIFGYLILNDTNRVKPQNKKDSLLLWYPQMAFRVFKEYEERFPDGRKAFWYKVCFATGSLTFMLWFFLSIWYAQ